LKWQDKTTCNYSNISFQVVILNRKLQVAFKSTECFKSNFVNWVKFKFHLSSYLSACIRCIVIFKFFWGGTWGCEKIWEEVICFRVLLHFYVTIFQSLLRGYMGAPLLPPPLCASMAAIELEILTSNTRQLGNPGSVRGRKNGLMCWLVYLDLIRMGQVRSGKVT
jgi:hypothetical protein